MAIGNADAHGRNHSLLHLPDGSGRFAPLYDVACIVHYQTVETQAGRRRVNHDLALRVNGLDDIDVASVTDLVAEGRSWGLTDARAVSVVRETVESLSAALSALTDPNLEDALVQRLRRRTERLAR